MINHFKSSPNGSMYNFHGLQYEYRYNRVVIWAVQKTGVGTTYCYYNNRFNRCAYNIPVYLFYSYKTFDLNFELTMSKYQNQKMLNAFNIFLTMKIRLIVESYKPFRYHLGFIKTYKYQLSIPICFYTQSNIINII